MTGQQRAVLWIGLIIVSLNLVSRWKDISGVIFSGAGITSGIGSGGSSSGGGAPKPAFPFLPNIPGITGKVPIIGLLGSQNPPHKTKNVQVT